MITALHPVTMVLTIMCLQWVIVGTVAGQTIKLPYMGLVAVLIYALLNRRILAASWYFVRQNAAWLSPFAVYLVILGIAVHGSKSQDLPLKQAFYMFAAVGLAGTIAMTPRISRLLRVGAGLGLMVFVVFVELLARKLGLSWFDAIRGFLRGDLTFVMYSFLRPVFNSLESGDVTFVAALKNSVAGCVFVCAFVFRAASPRPSRDIAGMAVFGAAIVVLLLLNTRSVIIVTALGVLLAMALSAVAGTGGSRSALAAKAAGAVVALVLVIGLGNPESPVSTAMGARYSFEDASAAARTEQATVAFERIQNHPLVGSGYYEVDNEPVHNLFLSAWMEAGLPAFLLVVTFYLALLSAWLSGVWRYGGNPGLWVLPIAFEWIAPLPVLPLFRVWLSGDGGHPFLGEWVGVAIFFGAVLANDLRRRAGSMRRAAIAVTPAARSAVTVLRNRNANVSP